MTRYSGKGWHFQHIRHSNARKYGRAGGQYTKYQKGVGWKQISTGDLNLKEWKLRNIKGEFTISMEQYGTNYEVSIGRDSRKVGFFQVYSDVFFPSRTKLFSNKEQALIYVEQLKKLV
jgi:hypothetical protein